MGSLKGLDARKAAMVMGIMTLHAFSEGLGVGVSYGGVHGRRQVALLSWPPVCIHLRSARPSAASSCLPQGLAIAAHPSALPQSCDAASKAMCVLVRWGSNNGAGVGGCGRQGMVTTWAIALHNIPEGLAVALVAVPRGESKWTAAAWAGCSLPRSRSSSCCNCANAESCMRGRRLSGGGLVAVS